MSDIIHEVNKIRNVPHTELRLLIKRVIVILSSPRSGSSLIKSILASHPDIASLDGEIEPYLALTKNGFGYNSDCDAIDFVSNLDQLADNIFDDLTVPSLEPMPAQQLKEKWKNRMLLQFPSLFTDKNELIKLNKLFDETLHSASIDKIFDEQEWQATMLSSLFRNEPWRICYYDGKFHSDRRIYFDEAIKIEEPPFVLPRRHRRQFAKSDIDQKILLFKTPPDAYRIGMYENIFPNAEIKYFHLTRGYAQSVNGLIDGWFSPVGFFSHDMERVGMHLDIKGYSDTLKFGKRWWKFELPPNWKDFTSSCLEDVCLNQWISPHKAILTSGIKTTRISFEDFLSSPASITNKIVKHIGLREFKFQAPFQFVMATEIPKPMRWKKRENQLLEIGKRSEVKEMMKSLDYEMDPGTWI